VTDETAVEESALPDELSIGGDAIRRFNEAGIQAQIDEALAGVEPGKHFTVTAFIHRGEQRLAAVAKLGDDWSVVGVLEHRDKKPWDAAAAVRWSPF